VDKHFSIVLPLKKKDRIDPGELITDLRLMVEQTGATVTMDPRMIHRDAPKRPGLFAMKKAAPEIFSFELDGVRMRVAMHSEPFAQKLEMGKFVNPVMWEYGLGEFTDHRAHFRVYEAGIEGEEGPDAVYDRAAAVTVTASVVAKLTEPVGAIWVAARNSVPMRTFAKAVETLKDGTAPLDFWMRWHVIPPGEMEDAHSGIITGGLGSFLGHELLARPSTVETRYMIDHAFSLARQILDEGLSLEDGAVVGGHEEAELRLRTNRKHRRDVPVCEFSMVHKPRAVPDAVSPELASQQAAAAALGVPMLAQSGPDQPARAPEAPADAAMRRLPSLDEIAAMGDSLLNIDPPARPADPPQQPAADPETPRPEDGDGGSRRVIRLVSSNRALAG